MKPALLCPLLLCVVAAAPAAENDIAVHETDQAVQIRTDALRATIRKKGYVSGIEAGSFEDKKTGAHDLGYGLHIMDFLLAPGWRDDGYERDAKVHGNLPKHYVEGPQICTQAKELHPQVVRGEGFVAIRMRYHYTQPGKGYRGGSVWEQTLLFQPHLRYILSCETITSANEVDDLFYRLDMPGHIKHHAGDNFTQVYLSYFPEPIPAAEFTNDFAPDAKYLYVRRDGQIPQRMIRAYQVKLNDKPGPWLAGMTLDPSEVAEAWCHQRGYVCMIEELHRRHVKVGETFGAVYVIGWFDDIPQMQHVYDQLKGAKRIVVEGDRFRLE